MDVHVWVSCWRPSGAYKNMYAVCVDELLEDHLRVTHRAGDGSVLYKGDEVEVGGLGQKPLLHSRQLLAVLLPLILPEKELVLLELVHGIEVEVVSDGVARAHQQHGKITREL